jgi:hypothetical protein
MKYEWEKEITSRQLEAVADVFYEITGKTLIGVAVADEESAEAALIPAVNPFSGVSLADVSKDVLYDAERQYEAAKVAAFTLKFGQSTKDSD